MSQRRQFTLNTAPHVAEIGEIELLFQPEVMGAEFLDAYEDLQVKQKSLGVDMNNLSSVDPDSLRAIVRSLRMFLARLMLPESAQQFAQWQAVKDETVLESFADFDDALTYAEENDDVTVLDVGLRLPDRVLVELLEWAVELYGGGQRPTGRSGGSAEALPPPGTRGRAISPSKASTRARGR